MDDLAEKVRRSSARIEANWTEERSGRVLERLADAPALESPLPRVRWLILAAVVGALLAAGPTYWLLSQRAEHSLASPTIPHEQPHGSLSLGADARAYPLGDDTRVAVIGPRGEALEEPIIDLESGRIRVEVGTGRPGPLGVAVGDVRITAVGSTFVVEREGSRAHVSVLSGAGIVVRLRDFRTHLQPGQDEWFAPVSAGQEP